MSYTSILSRIAIVYSITIVSSYVLGAAVAPWDTHPSLNFAAAGLMNGENSSRSALQSPEPFPVCTEAGGLFAPFCLPRHGQNMVVGATYYVTWNPDYYDLNATTTIELRYVNSSQGDSAYTSEKVENSYGYITLHMEEEWLQGKPRNPLTLYIIELDPTSSQRASVQQGPTVVLYRRAPEHYKPPPRLPPSKLALYVGVPACLGVVIGIVGGLYFGMRDIRRTGLGNVTDRGRNGYGIGKCKNQRVSGHSDSETVPSNSHELAVLERYNDGNEDKETKSRHHASNDAFTTDLTKFRSWSA